MVNLKDIVKKLQQERTNVERQLSGLNAAISAFAGVYAGAKPTRKRPKLSAEARAKISAAQRARWAKIKGAKKKKKKSA